MRTVIFTALFCIVAGCSGFFTPDRSEFATTHSTVVATPAAASGDAQWIILPAISQPASQGAVSSTADKSAAALIEAHLRARGVRAITESDVTDVSLIEPSDARYAVQATLYEWHYAKGLNRKPSVRMKLDITDVVTQSVIHSRSFVDTGRERATIVATANRGIAHMVAGLAVTRGVNPSIPSDTTGIIASGHGDVTDEALLHRVLTEDVGANASLLPVSGAVKTTHKKPDYTLATSDGLLPEAIRNTSVALFYAVNPPISVLSQFDRLILESDNITPTELNALAAGGATTYAYFSIGEVGPDRVFSEPIDDSWVAAKNPAWNSRVMNLEAPGWKQFVVRRVDELVGQGFDGLFLDTMDSYQLISTDTDVVSRQEAALGDIISTLKSRHPGLRLIANRGFEVLDSISHHLDAVAAESLYAGWNNTRQQYVDVPAADREWLTTKLDSVRDQYGLDVIAIDYLPPSQRDAAVGVAKKIAQQGFIPWVATPALDYVGVGTLDVKPREVMLMFDSRVDGELARTPIHKLVAMPLEYYGYVPVYHDVAVDGIPGQMQRDRLAGIVTYSFATYSNQSLKGWFEQQLNDGVPLVMFGRPVVDFSASAMKQMGLEAVNGFDFRSSRLSAKSALTEFEKASLPRLPEATFPVTSTDSNNEVHLQYTDERGSVLDVAVTGSWGAYVAMEAALDTDVDLDLSWRIDPFRLLEKALSITPMPMPDVTTENGRRLWLSHIDGDALPSWAEMPGPPRLGAEVIKTDILERFKVPHTVSVVEGEMTGIDEHADRRDRMFRVAREIFNLNNVELATHTYSHPYDWTSLEKGQPSGLYNLPIAGYGYDVEREIQGSVDFINSELAPDGKRVKLVLWTGAALPEKDALAQATDHGWLNMNGGGTIMSKADPTVAAVSPMARPIDEYVQVYAPIMNENVYTNDWFGPFDGFRRVIETLEMTDHPRRLKPINIYYHFYAGTKRSSMIALAEVYNWSMKQQTHPVFGSYYAAKVPDARNAGLARYLDGRWKLSNLGTVRSLRMVGKETWPNLSTSNGVIGASLLHDGTYIHTNGADSITLGTQVAQPVAPYLLSANGVVDRWDNNAKGLQFRVKGHVPVVIEIGGIVPGQCTISFNGGVVEGTTVENRGALKSPVTRYQFKTQDTGDAKLDCHA